MDNGTAIYLWDDSDVLYAQWYKTQARVMQVLAGLQRSGWLVTKDGLMTEGENGPIVVRPLKREGQDEYTGLGYWRSNPCNFDN